VILMDGSTTCHPSLLETVSSWNEERLGLALASGENLAGLYALSAGMVRGLADRCSPEVRTLEQLMAPLAKTGQIVCLPASEELWQRIHSEADRLSAERKLDRWLVKPTDGIYARMNRKISIPISRQLIKFPVTANMITIFTLGVGLVSAVFFARGGYWSTVLGAFLCLCASILDGCDGEVARLKLQESAFGCWLETACDYAFYLFLFLGMTIGLWRSTGARMYLTWGGALLLGAISSMAATAWERQRLAGARPERLLQVWQKHAENRRSNPFLYIGRHLEFMIRRCFFPYALVVFAVLGIINVAFVLSAIAANLVWPIALYSSYAFVERTDSRVRPAVASVEAGDRTRDASTCSV
jgi:phosphatidylglycerophosphate synthase